MTPIDFLVFDGDSTPNAPAWKVADAMKRAIVIRSNGKKYVVLSYYLDDDVGRMVLDIEEKD